MFNVISPANEAVRAIQSSLNQVLDPILEPVRRFMPDTGAIDFSPIVIMAGIQILLWVLEDIAQQV
ncbi:YggT family protein [Parasphingorhabdus sp. DH2-15]|uniref:YggT family protein n=1 Tax=Parasphingorhabdus sp. DH2-15 TaxID=3444112 RepID=UPI003F68322C